MVVYLLSAQFPGPTTPRDFVTMFLTSDQALSDTSGKEQEIPRHFMVISKPCTHPDAPPRDGFIRGQYESVEFIREIPRKKPPQKSASVVDLPSQAKGRNRSGSQLSREAMLRNASKHPPPVHSSSQENLLKSESDLTHSEGRSRGKTISFDRSRGSDAKGESMDIPRDDDDCEQNPVEWIMITRSDPGGSVPRFMIERGTPGGIVSDASKFLNWACAKDIDDLMVDDDYDGDGNVNGHRKSMEHNHEKDLHNYQTNGHLAGIEEATTPTSEAPPYEAPSQSEARMNGGGLYGMVAGFAGAAGGFVAAHTPAMVSEHFPSFHTEESLPKTNGTGTSSTSRRESVSSIGSASSAGSFASALEGTEQFPDHKESSTDNDASSIRTTDSAKAAKIVDSKDKELQKLEEKKRKLDEKLSKAREKEMSKKSEDTAKEEEALRKAEEKHEREVRKQEEKYKREVEKLEQKKQKEERKAEERKRKVAEKDDKVRLERQLEETRAELEFVRKERDLLRSQVGDLQAENTALAARVGRLGAQGEEVLREVRSDMGKGGRMRAGSLKGLQRTNSYRSSGSLEKDKENGVPFKAAPA